MPRAPSTFERTRGELRPAAQKDRPRDNQHVTRDELTTAHHQLDGFLGTALLAAEHETFTPVRHRLPANVLLLLGGD